MEPNHGSINYELLARYLAGEATESEQASVMDWLEENPANALELDELRKLWWHTTSSSVKAPVDTDAAWKKVKAQTLRQTQVSPKVRPIWQNPAVMGIAASFLLLLGLWWAMADGNQVLVASKTPLIERLEDGSNVTLNAGSQLEISEFNGEQRTVKLSGEAFFEVEPDAQRPFVIDAGPVAVTVLGTSFEVEAYPESALHSVAVVTGKVQVEAFGKRVLLQAGESAEINVQKQELNKLSNPDFNTLYWKTKTLIFSRTDLSEVIKVLNNCYDSDVRIGNPKLEHCSVNATFSDQSLEEVLEVLKTLFELKVEQDGKIHTLTGDGC